MSREALGERLQSTELSTLLARWVITNAALQAGEKSLQPYAEVLEHLHHRPGLMQLMAFGGGCAQPGKALSIYSSILKEYPAANNTPVLQEIALATAMEFAATNAPQQAALDRARYYLNAWQEGALNQVFDTLPFWQRRMVCGANPASPYGSVASLQWCLSRVHLPADQYKTCHLRCPYLTRSLYGDYVHSPKYYAPFKEIYGDNYAAMTYEIGGVCISLSHFAAFAAVANGIPAMAVSEPGHCAFLLLTGDEWVPAYSLSWQRSLHWQVFCGIKAYSSLHAATELFCAEQAEAKAESDAMRVLAAAYNYKGQIAAATACYQRAVAVLPANIYAWQEWIACLSGSAQCTAAHWQQLYDSLCAQLVPRYPELAGELMGQGIICGMARALRHDPPALRAEFLRFWENVSHMGPERWHIERLLEHQMEALGIRESDGAELARFYAQVFSTVQEQAPYAAIVDSWGITLSLRLSPPQLQRFQQVLNEVSQRNSVCRRRADITGAP